MKFYGLEEKRKLLNRPTFKILEKFESSIGAEIGVQYGINAKNILEKYDIKTLYLIDPYTHYTGISGRDRYDPIWKEVAHRYLKDYEDKIIWVEGFSWDVVDSIPNELDFVYVDGDHKREGIKRDLKLYYPKVRDGGLFAGHDYSQQFIPVKVAVNEFFEELNIKVNTEVTDWWIIK